MTLTHVSSDFQLRVFNKRLTDEAGERLKALDKAYAEKRAYQLDTHWDAIGYNNAVRDLAWWYVRALARAQLSLLWQDAKKAYRRDKQYRELKERYREHQQAEALHPGLRSRAPASARTAKSEKAAKTKSAKFAEILSATGEAIQRLTNEGLELHSSEVDAWFHLDTQSAVLRSELEFEPIHVGIRYLIRPGSQPLPFSGNSPDPGAERFTVSGGKPIPFIDLGTSVSYGVEHKNLSCWLGRRIVGPLHAYVNRSWSLAHSRPVVSGASLQFSISM